MYFLRTDCFCSLPPSASSWFCSTAITTYAPLCSYCTLSGLIHTLSQYIAQKLLEINERGTWRDPSTIPADFPDRANFIIQQDNEIFQTARSINCGWFGFVVFSDYFSSILGLVRQGNAWSLDVFSEFRQENHSIFERGRGNVCSVEVSTVAVLYPRFLTTPCSSTVCIVGMPRPPRQTRIGSRR